ncbi:Uncharacterised protein [Klebsiella pneumoniae]|uniref:HTH cro/C1-type domain-containing protein n=1 Tax=Klebsiella pneumoniae TaxID=573 RepID=A0A2X3FD01_KLEPN|nr:Uncharacterised protein [Klebsiella pneumoniae]
MSIHVELNDLMTRKGYSQTQVARAIGKSTAVINQYLQGKYAGDVPAIDALARSFINREVEKEKSQKITARFVPTVTSRKGMDVIRYAHLDGDLNVIYGAAGLGKTMILREYAAQHRDALLIEADPGIRRVWFWKSSAACWGLVSAGICMNSAKPVSRLCVIQVVF